MKPFVRYRSMILKKMIADEFALAATSISPGETAAASLALVEEARALWDQLPREYDKMASVLGDVSNTPDVLRG